MLTVYFTERIAKHQWKMYLCCITNIATKCITFQNNSIETVLHPELIFPANCSKYSQQLDITKINVKK